MLDSVAESPRSWMPFVFTRSFSGKPSLGSLRGRPARTPGPSKDLYKRNCIVDLNILIIGLYGPDRWPGAFVALLIA